MTFEAALLLSFFIHGHINIIPGNIIQVEIFLLNIQIKKRSGINAQSQKFNLDKFEDRRQHRQIKKSSITKTVEESGSVTTDSNGTTNTPVPYGTLWKKCTVVYLHNLLWL